MSAQASSWASAARTGKATTKCVLFAIASCSNENGLCCLSQKILAAETEQSVASVRRRLRDLEDLGLLVRKRRHKQNGARDVDLYQLQIGPNPQHAIGIEAAR
jgi:pyocin large subunit-like protein